MIDEKILIERLKDEEQDYRRRWKYKGENEEDWRCMEAMQKAIGIVEQLAEKHNNGWISVEDALPKESMPVLVTTGTEMIWTAFYDRTHGTWVDDVRGKVLNVIAWMELPAPYKKGE